ncbi:hypothetical protein [Rufibacter roseus]|uniref:Uncharacterized protein n=1 Tax=Rufibacter roseus TaxID=1567108 RepID=A0ABW2DK87_9BACT|nr:hypothetical protein [Rufibacter roseus]
MIEARELRNSSRVVYKDVLFQVAGLNFLDDEVNLIGANSPVYLDVDVKDLDPIPLTVDWLLRAGFEKTEDGFQLPNRKNVYRKHIQGYWSVYWDTNLDKRLAKLTYVHQLQNYIFATTGEELQFKD